ncbi:MAG: zinc-dependent alcohol dehydrogenase, partial [Bacillota bacterium]
SRVWQSQLTIAGTYASGLEDIDGQAVSSFEKALQLMSARAVPFVGLLTHRFALADYRQAFETALDKGGNGLIKATFVFD